MFHTPIQKDTLFCVWFGVFFERKLPKIKYSIFQFQTWKLLSQYCWIQSGKLLFIKIHYLPLPYSIDMYCINCCKSKNKADSYNLGNFYTASSIYYEELVTDLPRSQLNTEHPRKSWQNRLNSKDYVRMMKKERMVPIKTYVTKENQIYKLILLLEQIHAVFTWSLPQKEYVGNRVNNWFIRICRITLK